jgi:ABC-type uncharacterized transport system ATPase subunit
VSKDTLFAGERLMIGYEIEGGEITNIDTPEFTGLRVLAGPNVASSTTIMNGKVSQSASYNFVLQAISLGDIEIQQAQITIGDKIFKTDAIKIHVIENPNQEIMDSLEEVQPPNKKFKKKRKTYKI